MKTECKKLLMGILLLSLFYISFHWIGGADGMNTIKNRISDALWFIHADLPRLLATLTTIAIGIVMIYCFISGLFRITTFYHHIPLFEDKAAGGVVVNGHQNYPRINEVLRYRESRLSGLSPEEAAKLYVSSSKIESLYTGYTHGPETLRTLSYIESKLCALSNEKALNYLSSKL